MNRTGLISIAAAGALVLVACSTNTAGTPAAAGGASSAPVSSSAGSITGTPLSPPASSSEASSASEDTSTAEGSVTTEETTSSEETSTSEETSESTRATTTLSGTDEDTINWFTVFCGGFATLTDTSGLSPTGKDPAAYKAAMVDYLRKVGGQLTSSAQELSTIPPPGFDHGAELAAKVVTGFGTAGPELTAAAAKLEASSASTLEEISQEMSKDMEGATKVFSDLGLDSYDFDPATKATIKQIPACANLFGS